VKISVKLNAQVTKRMHDAAAQALSDIAEDDLRETLLVVPIEEGTLGRSGFVEVDTGNLTAQVAFDTPYALRQHEDPTLRHDAGRKDHFLEDTVEQNRKRHTQYLQQAVRDA
jgi:hypothetical protein